MPLGLASGIAGQTPGVGVLQSGGGDGPIPMLPPNTAGVITIVSDTFSANKTGITNAESGQPYLSGGNMENSSSNGGILIPYSGGVSGKVETYYGDVTVSVKVVTWGDYTGLFLQTASNNTGYLLQCAQPPTTGLNLFKVIPPNPTYTLLGQSNSANNANDVISFTIDKLGNITIKRNGTTIISASDTDYSTVTKHLFKSSNGVARFDDFYITTTNSTPLMFFEGDSRTVWDQSSFGVTSWSQQLKSDITNGVYIDQAVGGSWPQDLLNRFSSATAPWASGNRPYNIALVWAGTGGMSTNTGAQQFALVKQFCKQALAKGYNRLAVATEISRTPSDGGGATFEANRQDFNTLMRTYYRQFAHYLVDLDLTALGGPNGYQNTTLFRDGTHQTTAGSTIVKDAFKAAVTYFGVS